MNVPSVSIIMSVYNGAQDAPLAVRSILEQTFGDFELIAIDNGSLKDNTRTVLDRLARTDPRIRAVNLDTNIGLAGALNHGIGLARGRYIARQDHDDISRPERLAKQVAFMAANPSVGLLGPRAEIWAGDKPTGRFHDHATGNAALQVDLLSNNPFVHTSIMTRKAVLEQVGLYTTDPARQPPEDYDLWSRIARRHQIANLPDRLVVYREMAHSMSRDGADPFLQKLIVIGAENIAFWNHRDRPDADCRAAACLLHAAYDLIPPETRIEAVCQVLVTAVEAIGASDPGAGLDDRKAQLVADARHHFVHARKIPAWMEPLVATAQRLPLSAGLRRQVMTWLAKSG